MQSDSSSCASSDRHQRELFLFATFQERSLRIPSLSKTLQEAVDLRSRVHERMQAGGYVLAESGHYSPADFAGMDYVLFSRRLDRYFFIDVTKDISIKWSLPRLRQLLLFRIETDDEFEITHQTRINLFNKLLEMMDGKVFSFPLSTCAFPSLDGSLSAGDKAAEIEAFRERLQKRISSLLADKRNGVDDAAVIGDKIDLLRGYHVDLGRSAKYTTEEDRRRTDPEHLRRQRVFQEWAKNASERAVRSVIKDTAYPPSMKVPTHRAVYNENLDQIDLIVKGTRFILPNIHRLLTEGGNRAWVKMTMTKALWVKKTFVSSGAGFKASADYLAQIVEATPLLTLIGEAELPPQAKPKEDPVRTVEVSFQPAPIAAAAPAASGRPILTLRKKS